MPSLPRFTVIIPTYNWSAVLPFSIGSVLDQTFADFELLVVGDGCTDESAAVVGAIEDERVRWINLSANHGHQSAPNNEGLRQARGELIAYLGHDDLWLPHHLACMAEAIAAGADMAFGITGMIAPPGGAEQDVAICRPYRSGDWIPPSAVAHRRALIDQVGGWRDFRTLHRSPETDLWRRFHDGGARISLVPRLSTIKFPASKRRNVYRDRPNHEQATYAARIREDSGFEAAELGRLLIATAAANPETTYSELLKQVVRRTGAGIARRLMGSRRGAAIESNRRFKGLVPNAETGDPLSRTTGETSR